MSDLLHRDIGDLLVLFARGERGLAAGSAAALVAATAAALVWGAARASGAWAEGDAVAAQADALLARAVPLAELDAEAYTAARERLSDREGRRLEQRNFDLKQALELAAEVPLRIAEVAADVAELAAHVAERGEPAAKPDAASAAMLAEAAARGAAHLVEVNLAPDPERTRRGREACAAAGAALGRALASD